MTESSSDWRALAPQDDFGVLTHAGCEWRTLPLSTNRLRPISTGVKGQTLVRVVGKPEVIQLDDPGPPPRHDDADLR